ncbi:MAG: phosphopyruvate hydratase, partial [Actinobacteria bacterium]|nr:phosphopyruvate hydratase [Actinomycetota bacterium]
MSLTSSSEKTGTETPRLGSRRSRPSVIRIGVAAVTGEIAGALVGEELPTQRELDRRLIELDGTEDKSRLGGNAVLGVSLAAARAAAASTGLPLYQALNANSHVLPVPLV